MARTKIIPPEGLLSDLEYTSVIVSYSNGIDSTGALYWAVKNFPKEKIYRWCTAYLKTAVTDKWIRQHRQQLGARGTEATPPVAFNIPRIYQMPEE